jgi:hypothetical protein
MSYRPERGGGGGHSGSSGFGGRSDHRGGRGGGQGGRGDHPPPGSGGGGLPPARGDQVNVQLNLFEVRQLPTKPFAQYDVRRSLLFRGFFSHVVAVFRYRPDR